MLNYRKKILFSAIVTIAAVLTSVLGSHVIYQRKITPPDGYVVSYKPSDKYGWELQNNWSTAFIRINSQGFREDGDIPQKKMEDIRIVVIGDSVGFGLGLRNGETIPDALENEYRKAGIHAEAVNMCVPGWGTIQYLRRWECEGIQYNPDKVLIVLCTNDPYDDYELRKNREDGISDLDIAITRTRSPIREQNNGFYRWFFEKHALGMYLSQQHRKKAFLAIEKQQSFKEDIPVRTYRTALDDFIRTLEKITNSVGKDSITYLIQAHENHVEKALGFSPNNFLLYNPEHEELFRYRTLQYFNENEIQYIDGLDALISFMKVHRGTHLRSLYGLYYPGMPDGIHYSREGSMALAEMIYQKWNLENYSD
jgi:lysophospholipase L1-like esterase